MGVTSSPTNQKKNKRTIMRYPYSIHDRYVSVYINAKERAVIPVVLPPSPFFVFLVFTPIRHIPTSVYLHFLSLELEERLERDDYLYVRLSSISALPCS